MRCLKSTTAPSRSKSIAREAGSRTKMAVWSADPNVDPIGSCVGPKGGRVASIVNELGGEKIDIVKYSEDPEEYIAAALSPSEVDHASPCLTTARAAASSCRTISFPSPSARKARMPVSLQSSPATR